jgi:hypothetical protein
MSGSRIEEVRADAEYLRGCENPDAVVVSDTQVCRVSA